MNGWRKLTLGEVCDKVSGLIQTGPFGSQLHQSDYTEHGVPVVMPKDIVAGRISSNTVARVSADHVDRLSRHKLSSGDIIYGRRGDIGRQALIRPEQAGWMCGTGCLRISLGKSTLDPLFLHYYLDQDEVISWITNQAIGATMPNLNTGILRSIPVRFPDLPTQRRIAGILSAYDDLIENSQRRIKILEEMARRLYREWFVYFRFPGHENCRLVESSVGEIPEGWEILEFRHLFAIKYGKTLPKTEISDSGLYPVYGAGDVIGFYDKILCPSKCALVTSRGNGSGTVWRTREPAFVTNNSLIMSPQEDYRHWDYSFIELLLKHANVMEARTGSAQPQITIENLNYVKAIAPAKPLVEKFCAIVTPICEQVDLLCRHVQNLRLTRNLLLPRLLSGQIDVQALTEPVLSES